MSKLGKYLKTKDGIFSAENDSVGQVCDLCCCFDPEACKKCSDYIVDRADTVPELCDAFVVVTKDGQKHTYYSYEGYVLIMMECEEEGIETEAYGAIWVTGEHGEPILKSVAKRNTAEGKEDLELL